ncbi:MAG: hypothetical protein H6970_04750 [Gammaproteobacteria bacterium]|nr:hypothetical protein [Gammaproteobacteria bacterium]MCP5424358.1 hypothetical protein [Gammaproteobacteria bacterium]MCP5459109.1 hypothetical protein [Gammaproteobacteria bacterium]
MAGLLGLIGTRAQAWPEGVQLHGFASQGFLLTSDNNFFGGTDGDGSFGFGELGLNGSWQISPDLLLSLQVLSRRAGETDDGDLRMDYGFLDYSFISDADNRWGIRLGRIMNPLGLYNDTRDVAFTRPSILLPQSIYFDVNRNLALSADGVQLYGERRTDWGDFFLQLGYVYPRVDDPDFERSIFFGDALGDLESDPSWIGRLTYERDGGRFRFMVSGAQVNVGYDPGGPIDPFQAGKFRFQPLILSAQYNAERWSFTTEYAPRPVSLYSFGPFLPDTDFTGQSYYLQGTYKFAPRWEGLLRYDVLYWDTDDRDGSKFAELTGLPAHSRFSKDWTVGLRWDVTPSFMLRAEFHYIDGTGWLSELENPGRLDTDRYWNLFAILASFRF